MISIFNIWHSIVKENAYCVIFGKQWANYSVGDDVAKTWPLAECPYTRPEKFGQKVQLLHKFGQNGTIVRQMSQFK